MSAHRFLKVFVVLFSLAAGGALTWQLSRNLVGKPLVETESEEGEVAEESEDSEVPKALAFSSKSFAFDPDTMVKSDDFIVVDKILTEEVLKEGEEGDSDEKEKLSPLLLPSSKSGLVLPPQK